MLLGLFMVMVLLSPPAHAASGEGFSPFQAGSARLSLMFGGGTAFNQNYSILGVGAGYYVADGVEAGFDAALWSGNHPNITEAGPQLRVILNATGVLKPYVGVFYRRTAIEGYRDTDTVGGRTGLYILTGGNAYFGVGLAGDVHLNCDRTVYSSCTEAYPELFVALQF